MLILNACSIGGVPIPDYILNSISYVIDFIKIGIPLLLIIFGMIDLAKGVVAKKEEDMKKCQQLFLKKINCWSNGIFCCKYYYIFVKIIRFS